MRTTAILSTILVLAMFMQTSSAQDGRYATHDGMQTVVEMADGSSEITSHYTQITFANDPDHLADKMSGDCMGRFQASADGTITSSSGSCVTHDGAGNTASFWWRMDDQNSDSCSDICGSWGYYAGTGELKGITGGGTWSRNTVYPNGSSGTWTGSASVN